VAYRNTPIGKNIQIGAASSYAQFPNLTDYNPLGGVTVIALVRPNVSVAQNAIISKDTGGGGTATPFSLIIENGEVSLNRANTGFRVWNSVAIATATQLNVVAATQGANISVAPKFYINGVFDTGAPVNKFGGSGTGAPTASSATLKIGMNSNNANQFFGEIYDVLFLSRELSGPEVSELSDNIFAVWQAPARRLWVVPAAGSYTLTASPGAFSVSGTAASLKYGRVLQAASGSFAVTGTTATLKRGYRLQADVGSFGLSGTAATLRYGRVIQAAAASFQVSGTAASLKYGRALQADPGTFQITGTDATLTYGTAGSYTLPAQPGSFSVSGTAATLRYGRSLSADSGSFAFAGTAATLRYARRVIAESGTFSLTGTAATLTYSGAAGPVTSTVERTAIFRAIVARTTKFQRSKSVTVKFN
jgi:hypothetical protein